MKIDEIVNNIVEAFLEEDIQSFLEEERCWDGYERNYKIPKGERGSCKVQTEAAEDAGQHVADKAVRDKTTNAVALKALLNNPPIPDNEVGPWLKSHGLEPEEIGYRRGLRLSISEETLDEKRKKKKKKPCKKAKGKKFVKRVNGRCRSYGQSGKAKDGGARIRPGTKKGDAYCARSAKIKKCKNPPCANALSRKKWKCRGSKSMKESEQ